MGVAVGPAQDTGSGGRAGSPVDRASCRRAGHQGRPDGGADRGSRPFPLVPGRPVRVLTDTVQEVTLACFCLLFTSAVKLKIKCWKSTNSKVPYPRSTQTTDSDSRKSKEMELVIQYFPTKNSGRAVNGEVNVGPYTVR